MVKCEDHNFGPFRCQAGVNSDCQPPNEATGTVPDILTFVHARRLAVTAVVAIVLRTVDMAVYRRFMDGEATDEEVADVVFGLQGTALLRSESRGWLIQSRIILGLLATKAKKEIYRQSFSTLRSPLLDQWRELENAGLQNNVDVTHIGLLLTQMQQQWDAMLWRDPNRQIQTFLDSIRRLELLSPELGGDGSA